MAGSLVKVMAEMLELEAILDENGGEIPTGSDLEARWNRAAHDLSMRVDDAAEYLFQLEGAADRMEVAAKKLKATAMARRNLRERILRYVDQSVIGEGRTEVRGSAWRIRRRTNPPTVNVTSEADIAETCPEVVSTETTIKIDKARLREILTSERGSGVRGAVVTRGYRMEIVP